MIPNPKRAAQTHLTTVVSTLVYTPTAPKELIKEIIVVNNSTTTVVDAFIYIIQGVDPTLATKANCICPGKTIAAKDVLVLSLTTPISPADSIVAKASVANELTITITTVEV